MTHKTAAETLAYWLNEIPHSDINWYTVLEDFAKRIDALEAVREPTPAPTNTEQIDRAYALIGKAKRSAYLIGQTAIERQLEEASRLLSESEPAPAPETDAVTISRDEHEAARATVIELMNTIREIAIYADEERYNANASAYLSLTKVVELAQVTRRKYGDIPSE